MTIILCYEKNKHDKLIPWSWNSKLYFTIQVNISYAMLFAKLGFLIREKNGVYCKKKRLSRDTVGKISILHYDETVVHSTSTTGPVTHSAQALTDGGFRVTFSLIWCKLLVMDSTKLWSKFGECNSDSRQEQLQAICQKIKYSDFRHSLRVTTEQLPHAFTVWLQCRLYRYTL